MNLYEHTIIARQDASPSELKQLTEKYSKIVEKNSGEIIKTENWGLLNLTYLIKKNKNPTRNFTSGSYRHIPSTKNELRRLYSWCNFNSNQTYSSNN